MQTCFALGTLLVLAAATTTLADHIKFLSIGDWGDDTAIIGSGLSKFFAEEAEGAPLALLLGDNFYDFGVKCVCQKSSKRGLRRITDSALFKYLKAVDDHQWKKKYLDVFSGKNLEKIKFMVISGNVGKPFKEIPHIKKLCKTNGNIRIA